MVNTALIDKNSTGIYEHPVLRKVTTHSLFTNKKYAIIHCNSRFNVMLLGVALINNGQAEN